MPLTPGAEPFTAEGDSLGILVLHGFTGSPAAVKPWAQHLAAAGHTVTAPRLPGHGTRWQDLNATTWQDWTGEAQRSLDWLRTRVGTVVVMGLANGATIGLRLAELHGSAIAGLVAVNPIVHSERRERHALPYLYRVVPGIPAPPLDIKKKGVEDGGYDWLPLRAAHSLTQLWAIVRSDIHKVTQPLLVLRSADDHVAEPSNTAWLLANAPSAQAEEVVLENSFHVATLDHDADRVFALSLQFAEQVAVAS